MCLNVKLSTGTCIYAPCSYMVTLASFVQVCGVFALFLSGAHNFIWWGLYCYPVLRVTAVTAYFLTAGACILIGLTAKSNTKRALPMLVLLLLRFCVVLARLALNSGSWWASVHFLWMEVRLAHRTCTASCLSPFHIYSSLCCSSFRACAPLSSYHAEVTIEHGG